MSNTQRTGQSTNQVRLEFDNITKQGLKSFINKFKKLDCPVQELIATNKSKRESGMLIKDFTLVFEDEQKLLVRIKYDGTIFQVKLNNKVRPIKNVDNIDKALVEMIGYLQENADSFKKNKIANTQRKLKPKIPSVRTSRSEKIASTQAQFMELEKAHNELQAKRIEVDNTKEILQVQIEEIEENIKKEENITKELQEKIDSIQKKKGVS